VSEDRIHKTLAKLFDGEHDPEQVLRDFEREVSADGATRIEKQFACKGCGAEEVCFRCKSQEVIGVGATAALPLLIPKLARMAQQWADERNMQKQLEAQAQAQAQAQQAYQHHRRSAGWSRGHAPPPPPTGPQSF